MSIARRLAATIPWAITRPYLEAILAISDRQLLPDEVQVEVRRRTSRPGTLAAEPGEPADDTATITVRDGIAIVPLNGPIFRHANLLTEFSGAVSLGQLSADFNRVGADPAIRGILLQIDSPGGEATGIVEMADMIRRADVIKPVFAYVGDLAASGAYWLASAASKIYSSRTGIIGSIGAISVFEDDRRAMKEAGIDEIIVTSDASPHKNIDPATEKGRIAIKAILNAIAAEFIDDVAVGRKVSAEKVVTDFGGGGLLDAREALKVGMIDGIGTFEETLARMVSIASGPERRPRARFGFAAAAPSGGPKAKFGVCPKGR
jgi:signal peptide peptidase SppA